MKDLSHLKLPRDVLTNDLLRVCIKAFQILGLVVFEDQSNWHFIRGITSVAVFSGFTIVQFWQAFQTKDDINVMAVFGTIGLQFLVIMFRLFDYVVRHGKYIDIIKEVHNDYKKLLSDATPKEIEIINGYTKYGKNLSLFLLISTQFSGSAFAFIQIMRANYQFDQILNHPMLPPMLIPEYFFGVEDYYYACNFFNLAAYVVGIILMPSWHIFVTILITHSIMNLEFLNHRYENYQTMFDSEDIDKDEKNDKLYTVLSKSSDRQGYIRSYLGMLENLNGIYMQIDFTMYSVQLCLVLFQIHSAPDRPLLIFYTNCFVTMVAILWLYCWHANEVKYKSDKLSLSLYKSNWYDLNLKNQKQVLQVMKFSMNPITMNAGVIEISLTTFINILKATYSFFTLLRQTFT